MKIFNFLKRRASKKSFGAIYLKAGCRILVKGKNGFTSAEIVAHPDPTQDNLLFFLLKPPVFGDGFLEIETKIGTYIFYESWIWGINEQKIEVIRIIDDEENRTKFEFHADSSPFENGLSSASMKSCANDSSISPASEV